MRVKAVLFLFRSIVNLNHHGLHSAKERGILFNEIELRALDINLQEINAPALDEILQVTKRRRHASCIRAAVE
jgi:hypothetical protein